MQLRGTVPSDADMSAWQAQEDLVQAEDSGASDADVAKLRSQFDDAVTAANQSDG